MESHFHWNRVYNMGCNTDSAHHIILGPINWYMAYVCTCLVFSLKLRFKCFVIPLRNALVILANFLLGAPSVLVPRAPAMPNAALMLFVLETYNTRY